MATRWGIISVGKISNDFVSMLDTLPDHKVVAVAARDIKKAQEFADTFSVPKAYGSYEELANDPDVEVVYVGTIHPHHARLSKLMLSGNKHVLCEKPFGMNSRETTEVLKMAKDKNLFIMEAFWSRFFPAYQKLREHLQAGAIGEPRIVNATFGFTADLPNTPRLSDKELGGGALLDVGCYLVQFAQFVFGEKPEKIVATGTTQASGADDTTSFILHYSGGRLAVLTCSLSADLHSRAFVQGTKGSIEIPFIWSPVGIIVNGEKTSFPLPKCDRKLNFARSEGFAYEAQHVRECLLKGDLQSPVVSHAHTLEIAAILDEVRRQIGLVYAADNKS